MRQIVTLILSFVTLLCNAQTFRGGEIFRIKGTDVYWAAVKTKYFVESVARPLVLGSLCADGSQLSRCRCGSG